MRDTPTVRRRARPSRFAQIRASLFAFTLVTVLGMVAVFALASRAQAFSSDLNAARSHYPNIANTRLDDCTLCHLSGSKALNPYGQAYLASNRDFGVIEGLDSDGDGYSNLAEILALSFPGNPADIPVQPTPTNTPFPPMPPTPTPTATQVPPTATAPPPTQPPPGTEPPSVTESPPTTEPPPATEPPTATATPGEPGATPTEPVPTPLPNILDVDIQNFKVASQVRLDKVRPIEIRVDIRNAASVAGQVTLTVVGMQNGVEVYNQSMSVSDGVGGGGSRYFFPSYIPVASGEILWTAALTDEDPDMDQAVNTTQVSGVNPGNGGEGALDLDIRSFRVSPHLKYNNKIKPIDIGLEVLNSGMVNGQGTATVIGVQNGVEVYNQTIPIFDMVGGGHSRFHFPSYLPTASGEIIWTVTIGDDDPDIDSVTASTQVAP